MITLGTFRNRKLFEYRFITDITVSSIFTQYTIFPVWITAIEFSRSISKLMVTIRALSLIRDHTEFKIYINI